MLHMFFILFFLKESKTHSIHAVFYYFEYFIQSRIVNMLRSLIKFSKKTNNNKKCGLSSGIFYLTFFIICHIQEIGGLKGDLFSSQESLIEIYKSENIAMGMLRQYMDENKVEHEYLSR